MYPVCRHIMPNGNCCHSPALRGTPFCYFHTRLHRLTAAQKRGENKPLTIPVLEDRSALQIAVGQVLNALVTCKIDAKSAGVLLYGLQIATQNVEHNPNILTTGAVQSMTETEDGEELAPERIVCRPGRDCPTCDRKDHCENYQPSEDEDE